MELNRVLGRKELMSAAVGQIIGAGIFSLLPSAIGLTGKAASLSFLIAAFITLFSLIPRIFVNGTIRTNGGNYTHLAFLGGRRLAGAFLIIHILTNLSLSMYALSFAQYLVASVEGLNVKVIAISVLSIMVFLNIIGVKSAAKVQNILVGLLIIALVLFCVFGVPKVNMGYFLEKPFMSHGWKGVFNAAALLTFATGGASTIISFSAEAKNPTKDLPVVLVVSTIGVALIYGVMAVVSTGILPLNMVENQPLTVVAAEILPGPLYVFFVVGGAMLALITTLNSQLGSCTKPILQGCKDGWFPKKWGEINEKFRTPHYLIVFFYLIGLLPIIFDISLTGISSTVVFGSRLIDICIALTLLNIPKLVPNEWKNSRFYVSKGKLTIGAALSFASAILATYLTVRTMTPLGAMFNLIVLFAAFCFGYFVDKYGKVEIEVSYEAQ